MSDALDRIKQRQRPKVAPRDASLTSGSPDIQTSGHTDSQDSQDTQMSEHEGFPDIKTQPLEVVQAPGYQDIQTSRHTDSRNSGAEVGESGLLDTWQSRHTDMQTSGHQETELQTKRSTFRLEAGLIDRLLAFSRRQGISREVLIEAMYEYMEANPEALEQVVVAATQKHEYRQQLANRKRAESMINRFGGEI